MKLELDSYEAGFGGYVNYQWIDTDSGFDEIISPEFDSEEAAIDWYNRLKLYFCPNKNCHSRDVDPGEI